MQIKRRIRVLANITLLVWLLQRTTSSDQFSVSITVKLLHYRTLENDCCHLPKIQTKRPNLRVFCPKDENGIANSKDPNQSAV